ncbi:hypothetical protein [Cereibacter sphaeroides]|nr:hypothetical protein [Cereibacter sphaeroides]
MAETREEWAERAIAAEKERDELREDLARAQVIARIRAKHVRAVRIMRLRAETAEAKLTAIRGLLARYANHRCRIVNELKEVMGDE